MAIAVCLLGIVLLARRRGAFLRKAGLQQVSSPVHGYRLIGLGKLQPSQLARLQVKQCTQQRTQTCSTRQSLRLRQGLNR